MNAASNPQWPAPQLVNGALQVSPSQLALLHRCKRQWGFKYLFRREPRFEGISALVGKAFHAALQVRYMQRSVTPRVEQAMRQKVMEGFQGLEVPADDFRTQGRYEKALEAYNAHYKEEPFETLAVEMPLVVPVGSVRLPGIFWDRLKDLPFGSVAIGSLPIHLKLIIDRLIRYPDGLCMVADTKTSKDWKQSHYTMWKRSGAPKAYAWAVQEMARLHPELGLPRKVHGFLLDSVVIRREESTLKRKRKEGIEDHQFQRLVFPYTPELLEEWRVNALRQVREVLEEWAEGDLGFNETACGNFYGRVCPFIDVCEESHWSKRRLVLSFDKFQDKKEGLFGEKVANVVEAEEEA